MTTNFKDALTALIGKGAQKRNVERYSKAVKKAYKNEIERIEDEIEKGEDFLDDLTSHVEVDIKTGRGTGSEDAIKYVNTRIKTNIRLAELHVELRIAKAAYKSDFPSSSTPVEVAPATATTEG